jgi:hypothetical protein
MALWCELADSLEAIERQIDETRRRLPARSVKPALMMELLRLKDERESLPARLKALRPDPSRN